MVLEKISEDQNMYLFIDIVNEELYIYKLDYKPDAKSMLFNTLGGMMTKMKIKQKVPIFN